MDLALVVALAVTATLLAVSCGLLAVALAAGRRTRRDLEVSRTEIERLAARIDSLECVPPKRPAVPETGYLITDAGAAHDETQDDQGGIRTRVVISPGLAEPVVKALAFGYGVHRALSPQNRNRIRFEMRREVRRARKARRRTARVAQRQPRARSARRQAAA